MSHNLGLNIALPQIVEPLSFEEYFNVLSTSTSQNLNKEKVFKRYLCFGSLPKTAELQSGNEIREYVESRYGATLLEGIALVRPRTNMQAYLNLLGYIVRNIGAIMSPGSLVGALEKRGTNITKNTVGEYLKLAYKNGLLCCAKRIDLKTNTLLARGEKYYIKDLGFRHFLERQVPKEEECDALIENAIYLELNRRYERVFVGKLGAHTIDFVCSSKNGTDNGCANRHYYQIVRNPFEFDEKNERIAPLLALRDNYPKTFLTLEKTEGGCFAGVKCEYIIDWLLDQKATI